MCIIYPTKRNKSSELLKALSDSGGILGLSLYPHHLKDNTNCTIDSFCEIVARTAEIMILIILVLAQTFV